MSKKPKKVITTTYLPQTTAKKLKVFAAKTNRSMSDVMNKAVKDYIKPAKSNN